MIDVGNVKAIYLGIRGKNDRDDQAKKTSFNPQHGKFQTKGKGKAKKTVVAKKEDGATPSCMHRNREGHDEDHCWKLHLELRPKRFSGKGKQKIVETAQQDLGSDSDDETLITAMRAKGTPSVNNSFDSITSTSYLNESASNERKRNELFHSRVIIKHTTLSNSGSQANLILESLVKKLDLETKPHPSPYPLGWVSDKENLQVTKQCMGQICYFFQIG